LVLIRRNLLKRVVLACEIQIVRGSHRLHGVFLLERCCDNGRKPRDIYIPDLRLGSGIKVPTRDFH